MVENELYGDVAPNDSPIVYLLSNRLYYCGAPWCALVRGMGNTATNRNTTMHLATIDEMKSTITNLGAVQIADDPKNDWEMLVLSLALNGVFLTHTWTKDLEGGEVACAYNVKAEHWVRVKTILVSHPADESRFELLHCLQDVSPAPNMGEQERPHLIVPFQEVQDELEMIVLNVLND